MVREQAVSERVRYTHLVLKMIPGMAVQVLHFPLVSLTSCTWTNALPQLHQLPDLLLSVEIGRRPDRDIISVSWISPLESLGFPVLASLVTDKPKVLFTK